MYAMENTPGRYMEICEFEADPENYATCVTR